MRTFSKPNYDWTMSYIELGEICEEVYGITYDLQMGERGQGEYEIVTTGVLPELEGYWAGLGQGYGYSDKYLEGSRFVPFGVDHIEGFEEGDSVHDHPEFDWSENARLAIEKWVNQDRTSEGWVKYGPPRPFDKVKEDGEYEFIQPSLQTVINDLAEKKEIPEGTYMITIDW